MKTCSFVKKLQKEVDLSNNQTALDTKFKGNTTKIDAFKAEMTKMQAKLDALAANSTLMDTCNTLPQTQAEQKGAAQSSNDDKSAALSSQALNSLLTAVLFLATSGAVLL